MFSFHFHVPPPFPPPDTPATRIRSEGHPRTAGCCRYGTPIDYTPIDLRVILNSAARLPCDVPDNTTRPEHLSYANPPPATPPHRSAPPLALSRMSRGPWTHKSGRKIKMETMQEEIKIYQESCCGERVCEKKEKKKSLKCHFSKTSTSHRL